MRADRLLFVVTAVSFWACGPSGEEGGAVSAEGGAEGSSGGSGSGASSSSGSSGSSTSSGSSGSSGSTSSSSGSSGASGSSGGVGSSGSSGSGSGADSGAASSSSSSGSGSGGRPGSDAGVRGDAGSGSSSSGSSGGTGDSGTGRTGPCDIYAGAGTPCVAAHSTVRALYGAYGGNLYQVRRASDKTTKNIGVVAATGVADSTTQDAFCTGTTCTISVVYDQSPRGNNLTSAPAGGAKNTPDNEANATALKLTVGGQPAYALVVDTGIGYRDDKTSGVATGDQPETEYMVTSGKHFNGGCCFDYGNAETNNMDDGAATMEAVYFGNITVWGKGAGNGPWIMADLENGLYAGLTFAANPNDPTMTNTYVTAMVKGRSGSFGLKGADATTGALKTMYDGARPSGYNPMKKQGAIILGIGGDNSNGAVGTFFEGCMTAGDPPDSADDAVQANIVAAGYGR